MKTNKQKADSARILNIFLNYKYNLLRSKSDSDDSTATEFFIESIQEAKKDGVDLDVKVTSLEQSFLNLVFISWKLENYFKHDVQVNRAMKALIEENVDINSRDIEGNSLAHNLSLVQHEVWITMDLLSKENLNLNMRNNEGYTPFGLAINKEKDYVAEYLHNKKGSNISFEEAKEKFFSGEDQVFCVFGNEITKPLNSLIGALENSDLQ